MSLIDALRVAVRNADKLPDDPALGLPSLLGSPAHDAALLLADLLRTTEEALAEHAATPTDPPPPGWARLPDGQLAPLPVAKLTVGGPRATSRPSPLLHPVFLAARYAQALAAVRGLRSRIADDLPLDPVEVLRILTPSQREEWGLRDLVDALRQVLAVLEEGAPERLPLSTRSSLGNPLTT